jgi:regulatory protein YycI of two-component signal transduction system YycFG
MNWEATKNWLIAAFFFLDAVLGWQLVASQSELHGYVESNADLLANAKTLLADHGFTLNTTVPDVQPKLASFQGAMQAPPTPALWHAAFPKADRATVIARENVLLTQEGRIEWLGPATWQVTYTQALHVTTDSLLQTVWHGSTYQPDGANSAPGAGLYIYNQTYNNYPIFDAELLLSDASGRLSGYTQTAITKIHSTNSAKPVISALTALVSLANAVDKSTSPSDNRILSINLGYTRKVALTPSPDSATANYWFPVWRIVSNNQTYSINAFTGQVEYAP